MASSSSSNVMASSQQEENVRVSNSRYDVFLSFRGETRNSFTDHLYQKLHQGGCIPFRDNDDIDRGEDLKPEIERGIEESRASIVVLSEQYATSRWCLDELCLILKQRKKRDHFVLPIFYHVEPSDVRKQENTFKINVVPDTKWTEDNVERWKEALTKVGNLTGVEATGHETKFLGKVVDIIYKRLDLNRVYRPSNLVGMNTRDKEINRWLEQSDVQILEISGMGGSGKTTLARHIAYSNWQKFASISILEDIGSKTMEELRQLQEKLLTDILEGQERKIPSVWQGTCSIEKALRTTKALIVLDNIVEINHLFDLLGNGIETQCKIIITSRFPIPHNWFRSKSWRRQEFEMKSLDERDSLKLLSLHAFGSTTPKQGYDEHLIEKALRYCEGNPLALEVLGSSLTEDDSMPFWESMLNSFEKELHKKIQSVLNSSYDLLPRDLDKQLFLHIACFFVGKDMDYVEKILEPDYHATSGIKTLTERRLLFVSPNKKLMMHRLLQEMGRDIVYKESRQSPEERSRVWRDSESYKVLRQEKGSGKMCGLALDMEMLELDQETYTPMSSDLKTDSFKKMDKLKLLQLNWLGLTAESYQIFSEDLRWLCWLGFRLDAIPPDMYMKNLVAIDMSYSFLKIFEPPTFIGSLKILNLKNSKYLQEISNIFRLPNLETLILWNCSKLVSVSETLKDLTHLALLNITGCEKLCERGQKASVVGGGSTQPHSFLLPRSLERLFLKDCNITDTDYFPLSFDDQLSLKYLNLVNNPFESLPPYNHLKSLRVFDVSCCSELKCLQELPSTLAELYIYYCVSLEKVCFESHQFPLQEFGYEGCVNLTEVEGFFKLMPIAKLEEIDLGHMKWLREYQDLEVCLVGDVELTKGRSSCIQMLYEFNIMSTSLQLIKNPNMIPEFEHTSESPFLSFQVPSCPKNKRLKGLNITFNYTIEGENSVWFVKVSKTNGFVLMYNPIVYGKPDEVGTWLSYWPIGNILHVGDEVNVSILVMNGLEVQGCGAGLVYTDEEAENENLQENNEHAEILGGELSAFKLSTEAYYLCRCDFFDLVKVGILTPGWFRKLVGDTIDYTEIGGWRKTGRPQQPYQSYTELKYVRCIINGPESEDIYKIAEMSKASRVDKTAGFTSEFRKLATKDKDVGPDLETISLPKAFDSDEITESTASKDKEEGADLETVSLVDEISESTASKRDSVKLILNNELIKAAHIQSMKAHKHNQPYLTNKKHGAGSSSSSSSSLSKVVSIFTFKGLSEVDEWYHDDQFGETDVDQNQFPSLRHFGKNRLAKVNRAFLRRFQDLLNSPAFKLEVEKAVRVDHQILFTGHSSGGAMASFATLWMLDEYTRKRGIAFPIGCVTFGSPLIGDGILSHAVRHERWSGHFTHFVMQHDVVPRMMLCLKPPGLFADKSQVDQLTDAEQAVAFFKNVMIGATTVASHVASFIMEPSNFIKEMSSVDFVKVSPYRPFGKYVFCIGNEVQGSTTPRRQLVVENPDAVLRLLVHLLQLPNEDQDLANFALNSLAENLSYKEELDKNGMQLQNMVSLKDLNEKVLIYDGPDVVGTKKNVYFRSYTMPNEDVYWASILSKLKDPIR